MRRESSSSRLSPSPSSRGSRGSQGRGLGAAGNPVEQVAARWRTRLACRYSRRRCTADRLERHKIRCHRQAQELDLPRALARELGQGQMKFALARVLVSVPMPLRERDLHWRGRRDPVRWDLAQQVGRVGRRRPLSSDRPFCSRPWSGFPGWRRRAGIRPGALQGDVWGISV